MPARCLIWANIAQQSAFTAGSTFPAYTFAPMFPHHVVQPSPVAPTRACWFERVVLPASPVFNVDSSTEHLARIGPISPTVVGPDPIGVMTRSLASTLPPPPRDLRPRRRTDQNPGGERFNKQNCLRRARLCHVGSVCCDCSRKIWAAICSRVSSFVFGSSVVLGHSLPPPPSG